VPNSCLDWSAPSYTLSTRPLRRSHNRPCESREPVSRYLHPHHNGVGGGGGGRYTIRGKGRLINGWRSGGGGQSEGGRGQGEGAERAALLSRG
jgi:hypothetical protein